MDLPEHELEKPTGNGIDGAAGHGAPDFTLKAKVDGLPINPLMDSKTWGWNQQ